MGKIIKFPIKKEVEEFETYEDWLEEGYKGLEEFYKEVSKEVWYLDENGDLRVK